MKNEFFEMLVPLPNIRMMTGVKCNRRKLNLMKDIIVCMFSDDTIIESDLWWMICEGVCEFNTIC